MTRKRTQAAALGLAMLAAGCMPEPEPDVSGRALFQTYCTACHGTAGRGDGPAAADLPARPADLTRISARNGGDFPLARVMSKIDGYTEGEGAVMPELGPVLAGGPVTMVDTGDGIETPAPARLVALAEYVRGLQGE